MSSFGKKNSADDFWDIDKLLPKSKQSVKKPVYDTPATKKPGLADVTSSSLSSSTAPRSEKLHFDNFEPGTLPKKNTETKPKTVVYENFSSLISKVEIVDWPSSYNYYEYFCKNAAYFYDKTALPCDRVPFFSYVAQYSQMNRRQLDYYLWWRKNVRNNVFLEADISYIYLFLYEIINLGDLVDTKRGLSEMIAVWSHYREEYPELNSAVAEWVCDYSLVHNLPIPFPTNGISVDMIASSALREAFYGFDISDKRKLAVFLLNFAGGYSYRKSKYYGENKEIYDMVMLEVTVRLIETTSIFEMLKRSGEHHASRVAFMGALCSSRIRKHIEVDYLSLAANTEIKILFADLLKYTENKIRSYLGIRSRLSCHEIPKEMKQEIDDYFLVGYSLGKYSSAGKTSPVEVAAYEKLYEAPRDQFDLEKALSIESSSWETTEKLVTAFEPENEIEPVVKEEQGNCVPAETEPQGNFDSPMEEFLKKITTYRDFFDAVAHDDVKKQKELCRQNGWMAEAVVDEINEAATEIFDDILIEEKGDSYAIIEDYKSILTAGGYYAEF